MTERTRVAVLAVCLGGFAGWLAAPAAPERWVDPDLNAVCYAQRGAAHKAVACYRIREAP